MAVVVQFGQYGNQLGPCFFRHALRCGVGAGADVGALFSESASEGGVRLRPRAVLVDMEPKVVESCLATSGLNYDARGVLVRQAGSGNNWAHGHGVFGPRVFDELADLVSKETEKIDRAAGIFTLSSLAGGTGSGLSSYFLERAGDVFGAKCAISAGTVLPFAGRPEVQTQAYNAVLSLSRMLDHAGNVILAANDDAAEVYRKARPQAALPSFAALNQVLAHQLALSCVHGRALGLADVFPLSPSPLFALNAFRATPALLGDRAETLRPFAVQAVSRQMIIEGSCADSQLGYVLTEATTPVRYAAGRLSLFEGDYRARLLRKTGDSAHSEQAKLATEDRETRQLCASPRLFRVRQLEARVERVSPVPGTCCSSLVLNGNLNRPALVQLVGDAKTMLARRQFLHLYEQRGLEVDELIEAIARVQQCIRDYDAL